MRTLLVISIFLLSNPPSNADQKAQNRTYRYKFYRDMRRNVSDARRVFGGQEADLTEFPPMAALLDRYLSIRCSASIIAKYWALTAAHCVTSRVAYIKYNTRTPGTGTGEFVAVLYLYRHPNYKVVQEDEGRGMDVTLLHHDLGLIRARDQMTLPSPIPPISSYFTYGPDTLMNQEVTVIGFGRTEAATQASGEELFSVKLLLSHCDRGAWYHCICGNTKPGVPGRGVCSGDSGGPVVYKKVQVGITSMGPLECATIRSDPGEGATSVFTALYNYVDLINTTIFETDQTILRTTDFSKTSAVIRIHVAMIVFVLFVMFL